MPEEAYQSKANKGKPYDDNDETLFGVHAQVSLLFIGFRLCRRPLLTFDDLMLGWMDEQEYGILVKAPSQEPID